MLGKLRLYEDDFGLIYLPIIQIIKFEEFWGSKGCSYYLIVCFLVIICYVCYLKYSQIICYCVIIYVYYFSKYMIRILFAMFNIHGLTCWFSVLLQLKKIDIIKSISPYLLISSIHNLNLLFNELCCMGVKIVQTVHPHVAIRRYHKNKYKTK